MKRRPHLPRAVYPRVSTTGALRHRVLMGLIMAVSMLIGAPSPSAQAQSQVRARYPRPDAIISTDEVALVSSLDTPGVELQLAGMINSLRLARGVGLLAADQTLADFARFRSQDMVHRNYFSHEIPGVGMAPQWLLGQLPRARGTGENLGMSDEPNAEVVQALFSAWVASPSHLENMVRPQFTRLGVGVVEAPRLQGNSVKVITQLYAIASGPLNRAP